MKQYTVIISDAARHDQGFRGTKQFWWLSSWFGAYAELGLFWFLCEYFGRSAVRLLRPSELLNRSSSYQTDWLFIGLPTTITKEHLQQIRFRRMVLYDSTDFNGVYFDNSDRSFLLGETDICLKNWRDCRWSHEFSIGLLPIKRPPLNNKLRLALRASSLKSSVGLARSPEKLFDVGFVARPTGTIETNPRLRWLAELKKDRPNLSLWGGLVGDEKWKQAFRSTVDADTLESCWLNRRKVSFPTYFSGLSQSKVALAPSGYAPWTYRHFEAIYAKCIVVSNDLSHFEFLTPLPVSGMVEVPEGESVVPAIDTALALYERSPDIVDANVEELDRWLDRGMYSRKRRDTIDRFFSQLDGI